jgi:hypothetical protein
MSNPGNEQNRSGGRRKSKKLMEDRVVSKRVPSHGEQVPETTILATVRGEEPFRTNSGGDTDYPGMRHVRKIGNGGTYENYVFGIWRIPSPHRPNLQPRFIPLGGIPAENPAAYIALLGGFLRQQVDRMMASASPAPRAAQPETNVTEAEHMEPPTTPQEEEQPAA